jgi:hypothetical protein
MFIGKIHGNRIQILVPRGVDKLLKILLTKLIKF